MNEQNGSIGTLSVDIGGSGIKGMVLNLDHPAQRSQSCPYAPTSQTRTYNRGDRRTGDYTG